MPFGKADMHTYVERVDGKAGSAPPSTLRRVGGFPAHAFSIRLHTNKVHATPHGTACTCIT
ncbi:hypothetical protein HD842_002957 [Massilia aurea]|uniref:Uncharacterized protein n=1 Tax=Massilia aurea TaxID=373040 RepID=A0A7W9X1J8_9BURK|nr:hypothetical protein [Massilia aurea]